MDYIAAADELIKYFGTAWAKRCPVAYPDFEFKKPTDREWVTMTIKNYDAYQSSIGAPGDNRQERYGMIIFQCFCPGGTRGKLALQRANEIVDLYSPRNVNGVKYRDPVLKEIGNDIAGFFQINVTVYFKFEDFA